MYEAVEYHSSVKYYSPKLIRDNSEVITADVKMARRGMFHPGGTLSSQLEAGNPTIPKYVSIRSDDTFDILSCLMPKHDSPAYLCPARMTTSAATLLLPGQYTPT